MSEQRLRELGREAQDLVDLPDLGSLERRGRALRFRRQAGVVAAAVVLAATGVFLFQDRSHQEPQPAPRSERIAPYPGALMDDLEPGTYELTPSRDGADPTALITVPEWLERLGGPQPVRRPPRRREQRRGPGAQHLGRGRAWCSTCSGWRPSAASRPSAPRASTWATPRPSQPCGTSPVTSPRSRGRWRRPVRLPLDAHPADAGAAQQECARELRLFGTDTNGGVGIRGDLDVYVVDVEGTTYVVVANEVGEAPEAVRDELAGVLVLDRVRDAGLRLRAGAPTAARRSSRSGARGCGTRRTRSCRPRGPRTSRRSTA